MGDFWALSDLQQVSFTLYKRQYISAGYTQSVAQDMAYADVTTCGRLIPLAYPGQTATDRGIGGGAVPNQNPPPVASNPKNTTIIVT
jgi:hypothetical protein